jgi:hypothetical protein
MNSFTAFAFISFFACLCLAKAPLIYLSPADSQEIANQLIQKRAKMQLGWITNIPTPYIEKHIDYFLKSMGNEAACTVETDMRPMKFNCKMIDGSNIVAYELRALGLFSIDSSHIRRLRLDNSTAALLMKEQF